MYIHPDHNLEVEGTDSGVPRLVLDLPHVLLQHVGLEMGVVPPEAELTSIVLQFSS